MFPLLCPRQPTSPNLPPNVKWLVSPLEISLHVTSSRKPPFLDCLFVCLPYPKEEIKHPCIVPPGDTMLIPFLPMIALLGNCLDFQYLTHWATRNLKARQIVHWREFETGTSLEVVTVAKRANGRGEANQKLASAPKATPTPGLGRRKEKKLPEPKCQATWREG